MGIDCFRARKWKLYVVAMLVCCGMYFCFYTVSFKKRPKWKSSATSLPLALTDMEDDVPKTLNQNEDRPLPSSNLLLNSDLENAAVILRQEAAHDTNEFPATNETKPASASETDELSQNCTRKNDVMFLKTHKTASSAVQNILLRFGTHYNLTFVLPHNQHDFGFPATFRRTAVHDPKGKKNFNILCHHMRYNHNEIRSVMSPDSFYVSILREPGALFESTFEYLWPIVPAFQRVPQGTSPEKWLDNAAEYLSSSRRDTYWLFAKNPIAFDFGYDNMNENEDYIQRMITDIEQRFDLLLIADYFEESMVLLSDALCWPLEDVACLNLNSRKRGEIDLEAKARVRQKARAWNRADTALFDHFNATLWRKIEAYGHERMRRALTSLREINEKLADTCVEGGEAVDTSELKDPTMKQNAFKPRGVAVAAYNLKKSQENNQLCRELVLPENAFNKIVFRRQFN